MLVVDLVCADELFRGAGFSLPDDLSSQQTGEAC